MSDSSLVFDIVANTAGLDQNIARAKQIVAQGSSAITASLDAMGVKGGKSFEKLSASVQKSIDLVQRLKTTAAGLSTTAFSQFQAGQGTSATDILGQIAAAGSLRGFLATVGGGLGATALTAGYVAQQAQILAALKGVGDEAGVSAGQVAGFEQALGKLGVSGADADSILRRTFTTMVDAKAGTNGAAEAFRAAGIAFENADGSLRPTIAVLQDVIAYLRGSASEADKTKLAAAAFGDTLGSTFVNAVKAAGSSLDDLAHSTATAGHAIETDLARGAEIGVRVFSALNTQLDQYYSKLKEVTGLKLSDADKSNILRQNLADAIASRDAMQKGSTYEGAAIDPGTPEDVRAANVKLFAAAKALADAEPIRTLPGGASGEVNAAKLLSDAAAHPAAAIPVIKGGLDAPISLPASTTTAQLAAAHGPNAAIRTGGGGGGRGSSTDDSGSDRVATVVNDLGREAAAEKGLADAQGLSFAAKQRSIDLEKAAQAAQERGTPLTDAEKAHVLALADAYSTAHQKIEEFERAERAAADAARFAGDTIEGAFEGVIVQGNSLRDTMRSLLQSLESAGLKAIISGSGPLAGTLGTSPAAGASGAASGVGGILGLLAKAPALFAAEGGRISGPGTGRSDSIPAFLSHGEFIVNSKAAAQHGPLLDAINSGRLKLPHFAEGGSVGSLPAIPRAVKASGSGSTNHNVGISIDARGAQGNAEIQAAIQRGVTAGMNEVAKRVPAIVGVTQQRGTINHRLTRF